MPRQAALSRGEPGLRWHGPPGRWIAGVTTLLLLNVCVGADAATVYRCGPEGRTYSQWPCPGEDGHTLDASDPRKPDQQAEGHAAARRQAAAADGLATARRRLERAQPRGVALIRSGRPGVSAEEATPPRQKADPRRAGARPHGKTGDGMEGPYVGQDGPSGRQDSHGAAGNTKGRDTRR